MRTWDVTQPLWEGMPVWPGDPPFQEEILSSLETGNAFRVSRLLVGSHAGTHVDAPAHALLGGDGVDVLPIDALWGGASLRRLRGTSVITASVLGTLDLPADCGRLLLSTRDDPAPGVGFDISYSAFDVSGAHWLATRGIRLVGVDSPSVEPYGQAMGPVHRVLLSAGVVIVENLALSGIPEGEYEFVCLPMKVRGGDGAPARALLRGSSVRNS